MEFRSIRPGAKFIDPHMTSQPKEYRVHRVVSVDGDRFTAEHIATGIHRTFGMGPDVLSAFVEVGKPVVMATLDGLVGEKVRIALTDGGTLQGTVTAIRYHVLTLDGIEARSVSEVEIDHSGATSYKWGEIASITKIEARKKAGKLEN